MVAGLLEHDFDVVKAVGDGQAVIDEASRLRPDVLVLDITMPIVNGLAAARRLKAAGFSGKIIFLTVHGDADYVRAAHSVGAEGYVVKNRIATDLLLALREVLADRSFVSPNLVYATCDSER